MWKQLAINTNVYLYYERNLKCISLECEPPTDLATVYAILRGNMYSIGSKLVVHDSCIVQSTLVCGQNGQWSGDSSTLEFATCPGTCHILSTFKSVYRLINSCT